MILVLRTLGLIYANAGKRISVDLHAYAARGFNLDI